MTLITFIPFYGYTLTHNNVVVEIMLIMNLVSEICSLLCLISKSDILLRSLKKQLSRKEHTLQKWSSSAVQ